MSDQYENGILDGMKLAWIEAGATEHIEYINETQFMLTQLALDQAAEDPKFRQIMLARYSQMLEASE